MNQTDCMPRRAALLVAATALSSPLLSGCAPLLVGGAVLGGTWVATDRRTSGIQLEDEGIEIRAANRLRETFADTARINVTSYNRQVLLTGEVASPADQQRAFEVVSGVENVRSIVNELAVLGQSTLTSRTADTLVSARVKAAFVDAKDLYANAFKVVTARGTTYLMGRVTQREATRATEVTRSVSGVQRVIRVFEIISEEELKRMLPQPAQPSRPATTTAH
jgi:osmotically-inducible protein OsmY